MDSLVFDVGLNFHGIGTPNRVLEDGEDLFWITEAFFRDVIALVVTSGQRVLITFDDGNSSDIEIAAPILLSLGLTATILALVGRLDQPGSLSRLDLKTLSNMGMEIGNHGYDQVDWRTLDADGRNREFVIARDIISSITGKPVTSVGIPYGKYNRLILRELRSAGYTRLLTSDGGLMNRSTGLMARTSVRNTMSLSRIDNIIHGKEPTGATLRRKLSMLKKSWT
jgi:peptidoglycan/xylan/chitin deacetylase (PgdA/CDA1 family)